MLNKGLQLIDAEKDYNVLDLCFICEEDDLSKSVRMSCYKQ